MVLAHRPFEYTSFTASGQHGPRLSCGLFGRGCAAGSFDGFSSALPCPPVFGVILPDGLVEVFFKLLFVLNAVGDVPQLFVQQLPEHYAFLRVLLVADIALVLEAAFFGRRGEDGGYLVCHHRSAVAGGRYQKHSRTEGFTALHLAPRGAFRRMEHSARPAPVRLHECRLFQDGAKFRGKIGIFPQDTGGVPAAGVHQQGIGVAVRFGTAAQQFSVVIAGRVIARPFAWHGSRLLSASGQHGPRSTLCAAAGLFLRGPFRLCLFGCRFPGFELVTDGRTTGRAALRHLFQLCLIGLQHSGIELFPELLCDRVGHIPVAAFSVRLAGHPKKEALAALYDFQIFHHKAVIEFHAGKAHEIFHGFDDPHAYIQLQRGGWCSARSFFLHGFLLSASGQNGPKSLNDSRRWILQDCLF